MSQDLQETDLLFASCERTAQAFVSGAEICLVSPAPSEIPANSVDVESLPGSRPRGGDSGHQDDGCLVCGGHKFTEPFSRRLPWVAQCETCGLVFAHPQPTDAELLEIYDDAYFATFGYRGGLAESYRRMKRCGFQRLLDQVRPLVEHREVRLLDVGSGLGDMLFVGQAQGWRVCGLEPNPWAVERANAVLPGATIAGTLSTAPWSPESFDVISCLDVLEHLRQPRECLERMLSLLRPGGLLLITTIDIDSFLAKLSGHRWVHFHRDHLWYFNRRSLSRIVTAAGFDVVLNRTPAKVFNLNYLLGILRHQASTRVGRSFLGGVLRLLPRRVLAATLPPLPEGQLLLAKRPN